MTEYRITICNRAYTNWYFTNIHTNEVVLFNDVRVSHFAPYFLKWISGDVIRVESSVNGCADVATLVYSPIRNATYIAGVLVLDTNRTYGRTPNKKRLFYKCIPNNLQYPSFLVPYETTLGFSKNIPNKYVLFRFDAWRDTRPHGLLTEVIGDVSNSNMYHEYQLYCRNLRHSLSPFINKVREAIRQTPSTQIIANICANPDFQIHDISGEDNSGETKPWIFSIDPDDSTDLDDAFSISRKHADNPNESANWIVSVYIANVFVWMETLGLWNTYSERISTIYLPEKKLSMLPPVLADTLCSLLENEPRFACVMDVEIASNGILLPETARFRNAMIRVSKNYRYESRELLADKKYAELLHITQLADPNVRDSHDVVSYWMVQMNTICGARLASRKTGVFRAMSISQNELHTDAGAKNERRWTSYSRNATPEACSELSSLPDNTTDSTLTFFRHWNNTNCLYTTFAKPTETNVGSGAAPDLFHAGMGIHAYVHITSPIRRLVDIINQTLFVLGEGVVSRISGDALAFCEKWMSRISDINTMTKSIRKLQNDCEWLDVGSRNPSIFTESHSGVLFEKRAREDTTFSYMVYLEDLKRVARIRTIHEYNNYTRLSFRLFFFSDEDNVQTRIQLQLLDNSQ